MTDNLSEKEKVKLKSLLSSGQSMSANKFQTMAFRHGYTEVLRAGSGTSHIRSIIKVQRG